MWKSNCETQKQYTQIQTCSEKKSNYVKLELRTFELSEMDL